MIGGKYFRCASRVSFYKVPSTDQERERELRTDVRFKERFQPAHHREYSLLETLPIDMIKHFPISDSLHLFDLGLMKR